MITAVALLIACAIVIYLSCEYFVNGVEWVGVRLGVAQSAVGTVLAAFGTALPESVVTFVAVVTGTTPTQKSIGVGAALGGPLVLATIAYAVVGAAFLAWRRKAHGPLLTRAGQRRLARDQGWFLVIFAAKVGLGVVTFSYKPWLGVLFLMAYLLYSWREVSGGHELGHEQSSLEPLRLRPRDAMPATAWAVGQTLAALAAIFVSSQLFVHQLEIVSPALGLSAQLTALLLSPIATELPETLNAVIWVRQGKTALALGNISGSMMIQATVPSALGILFTPWLLERPLLIAAAVTAASIGLMWLLLRSAALTAARLAVFGLLYGAFVWLIVR